MGFTTLIDQAIFSLALPSLRSGLHASPAQLQLIISIYSIAFGVALVPAGRLGDMIGRRRLFLLGLTMFMGFSIVGGLAKSAEMLIVSRLLQGVGAGIINTQVLGLIQELFDGAAQAQALGRYASAGGLSGLAGPILGGVIIALTPPELGWRLLLLVNVPFGIAVFVFAWRNLPHGVRSMRRDSMDAVGLVLLTLVTVALMSATLVDAEHVARTRISLVLAPTALVVFVAWEIRYQRRGATPILSRGLIRSPGYVLGTVVAMCQFASGLTFGMISTFFFLDGLHISTLFFAALSIGSAAGMVVSARLSWRYVARFGRAGNVVAIVAQIILVSLQGLAMCNLPPAGIVLVYPMLGVLQGVMSGVIHAPNQALAFAEIGHGEGRGLAAGFFQLTQRLACSVGMSWGTGVFFVRLSHQRGLDAYRDAYVHALGLVLLLSCVSLVAAWTDWERRRRIVLASVNERDAKAINAPG
jgi:MFS family permease